MVFYADMALLGAPKRVFCDWLNKSKHAILNPISNPFFKLCSFNVTS
ncbi:hypothetical protein [Vibrio vulnificus YJ016]|uniref:Uncharacterized protein n=1 Tax=Vibrio vulnificus (strain YJ016) TaxID=196600 RepID=Q7MKK7_VIBVY|nr:hypothetical protein [Vibrio vulnificus YJ016]